MLHIGWGSTLSIIKIFTHKKIPILLFIQQRLNLAFSTKQEPHKFLLKYYMEAN
jgi:hypothetical protein